MKNKLFKFWGHRLEVKLSRMTSKERLEFLGNRLIKELDMSVDESCSLLSIWVHDKDTLEFDVDTDLDRIICKYTGK